MTLDAFLVEYDMFGGPGLFPPKAHVKEWYAIGQGLVRSERYGPDGSQLYFTVEFAGEKKR